MVWCPHCRKAQNGIGKFGRRFPRQFKGCRETGSETSQPFNHRRLQQPNVIDHQQNRQQIRTDCNAMATHASYELAWTRRRGLKTDLRLEGFASLKDIA